MSYVLLCRQLVFLVRRVGKAGEGNRTLVFSLEGYGSTIELHPHVSRLPAHADFQSAFSHFRSAPHFIFAATNFAVLEDTA
jgi:hypothetical protein